MKTDGEPSKAPEVRLELTTYRLTAGRATDCAIQDLVLNLIQLFKILKKVSIPVSQNWLKPGTAKKPWYFPARRKNTMKKKNFFSQSYVLNELYLL